MLLGVASFDELNASPFAEVFMPSHLEAIPIHYRQPVKQCFGNLTEDIEVRQNNVQV